MATKNRASVSVKPPALAVSEYAARRERVLKALDGAVGLVMAGDGKANAHFRYLTGLSEEHGGMVLFDPSHEDPKRRIVLVLRAHNPELDQWDGFRPMITMKLKEETGFVTILRHAHLPGALLGAARRCKRLACLLPLANHEAPVSADLALFRKLAERVPGCAIVDRTEILRELRTVKSPAEIAMLRHAVAITAKGYEAALATLAPGVGEQAVHRAIERAYQDAGGQGTGYESIVGSGFNATVLHYRVNNGPTNAGELMIIDSGAVFGGYTADITRAFPVSGRFTREQARLYNLVLEAQLAAIAACKPGATLSAVGWAARSIIEKAGFGDYYPHGIGHQLGMEVHDLEADAPLRAGMVVTIEPGVYIPDQKLGIRIEDDVLITAKGREVLSPMIPKTISEIERAMKG